MSEEGSFKQVPYFDLNERIYLEVIYGNPDRKFSKRQLEEEMQKFADDWYIPQDKMKLCVAHCIYNEEKMLEKCLENDLLINDLDIIHILDGAWEHFDGEASSTDRTKEIIDKFIEKTKNIGITIIYETHPENKKWASESEKRNYQLERLKEICGDVPSYAIVKDADEFFHFTTGVKMLWLKKSLMELYETENSLGMMKVHPYYSHVEFHSPRLFPLSKNFHYYTEKSMCVHDENCDMVCDSHPTIHKVKTDKVFMMQPMVLINHLHLRDDERKHKKLEHVEFLESQLETTSPCKYIKNKNDQV